MSSLFLLDLHLPSSASVCSVCFDSSTMFTWCVSMWMFFCDHTLLCWAEYAPHLWCHACIALLMCYIYIRLLFGIACLAYHTAIKFALYQPLYPEFIVNYCFDIKRAAATFALFACTLNGKHKVYWYQSSREKVTSKSAKITVVSNSYHTLKIWESVVDRKMRQCTNIHESQFGFMPGRSATYAISYWNRQLRNTEKDRRTLEWHS